MMDGWQFLQVHNMWNLTPVCQLQNLQVQLHPTGWNKMNFSGISKCALLLVTLASARFAGTYYSISVRGIAPESAKIFVNGLKGRATNNNLIFKNVWNWREVSFWKWRSLKILNSDLCFDHVLNLQNVQPAEQIFLWPKGNNVPLNTTKRAFNAWLWRHLKNSIILALPEVNKILDYSLVYVA